MQTLAATAIPGINGASRMVLLRLLEQYAVSPERLCAEIALPLDEVQNAHVDLGMEEMQRLLEAARRLSGRQQLMLEYGQEINIATLGVLGYALMCCANLREVLDLLIRYHHLVSPECDIRYKVESHQVALTLHRGLLGQSVGIMDAEVFFASVLSLMRGIFAQPEIQVRLDLRHEVPSYRSAYEHMFGEDLHFTSHSNTLSFSSEYLERAVQFANPALKQIYQNQCELLLEQLDQGRYSNRVQRILLETPGQFPGIEQAADTLKIGSRTLRRRLAAENTTYKQLVQNVRCQLAEEYLRDSPLSIQEIADMLGYSDVANFRRAFMAWKALSPAQFRKQTRRGN